MAIVTEVSIVEWRIKAGSTIVYLDHLDDGTWSIHTASDADPTILPARVVQQDAIDTATQYAVLLEEAIEAEQAARVKRATARTYISDAPRRLANQPQ